MLTHKKCMALCLLLLLVWTGTSLATVKVSQVSFESKTSPTPFRPGESQRLELDMAVRYPVTITDIELVGRSWTVSPVIRTLTETRDGLEIYRLKFDVSTTDASQPLEFIYNQDGQQASWPIDLSDEKLTGRKYEGTMTPGSIADIASYTLSDVSEKTFDPEPLDARYLLDPEETGMAPDGQDLLVKADAARFITVTGNIGYWRGGVWRPGYGATIQVVADTWGPDTPMGSGRVEADGSFSISCTWWYDPLNPDIYVRVVAGNSVVSVYPNDDYDANSYTWRTENFAQVEGTELDIGAPTVSIPTALNILGSIVRANAWMYYISQYTNVPKVHVTWPEYGPSSYYIVRDGRYRIYITDDSEWDEAVGIHEYGHHFVKLYGTFINPVYCNEGGECDDPVCTHCVWCEENANIAFSEGFPNWMSDSVCRDWGDRYGFEPVHAYDFEEPGKCHNINYADPELTEGFFASLLRDIDDITNERGGDYNPEYQDRLNFHASSVLNVVDGDNPTTPRAFINGFLSRNPNHAEELWETCARNGYLDLDFQAPTTNALQSSSHTELVISFNNYVDLFWTEATDDFSGVGGYSFTASPSSNALPPDQTVEIDRRKNTYTAENLSPGIWTFAIRAVDRDGNWDSSYQEFGPVLISEPDLGDLRPEIRNEGWDYPCVPKDTPTANSANVRADTETMYGNTYWNASFTNYGDLATAPAGGNILVDGTMRDAFYFNSLDGGFYDSRENRGPILISGGRHTFEFFVDSGSVVAEPNEDDNRYGHQWVWTPDLLTYGTVHTRSAPPLKTGGFDSVTDQLRWNNCDGLNLLTLAGAMPSPWAIVATHAVSNDDDVDLQLHDAPTGAADGFDYYTYLEFANRPAGYLDAVIVNAANRPAFNYSVGVYNNHPYGVGGDYMAQVEYGEVLFSGLATAGTLEENEGVALFTFTVTTAGPIKIQLQLDDDTNAPPIYAAWYDEDFVTGSLLDYNAVGTTNTSGSLEMDITAGIGTHGLLLWRDPVLTELDTEPYTITVGPAKPELTHFQPVGWDAPLIPAPGPIVTPTYGPEPLGLWGETESTYMNVALENRSSTTAAPFHAAVYVDGVWTQETYLGSLAGWDSVTVIPTTPVTVRGGRHLVSFIADRFDVIDEEDEWNNTWGSQYVWRPALVGFNSVATRSCPPGRTTYWDKVKTLESLYFNCDGIRTDEFFTVSNNYHWAAVGIMPGEVTDIDLRLHLPHTSARTGFDIPLVESTWIVGQSDFVLMNFRNNPLREFEAGMILGETGYKVEDYTVTTTRSRYAGTDPSGVIGTYSFDAGQFVDLLEFQFSVAGNYEITLDIAEPTMDLGFSLYGPDQEYYAKDDVQSLSSAAWLEPAGASESFLFSIDSADVGYYCLAIWKVGTLDGPVAGSYTLTINEILNLPDMTYVTPTGWDAPLVPRPAQDATYTWAPLPASILGDTATTYFNFASKGESDAADPPYYEMDVMLDGVSVGSSEFPGGSSGYTWYEFDTNPNTVTGGRHTLAYLIDPTDDVVELDETNNTYAIQYVWTPKTLLMNTPDYRVDPKPYFAGWEYITDGFLPSYNCDAIRTPYFRPVETDGYYSCVAIMPEDISNPNLDLHTMSTGLTDGFTTPLESSNFPAGHSDFILINFNANYDRQFDAGITISESNNEEIKVVVTESAYMGQNPVGPVPGTHVMGSGDLVNIFEFGFTALGTYRIELDPLDANCDLGISLYGPDAMYYSKVDVVDDGVHGEAVAFMSPPGERESFDFILDTAGYYAFAVWKVGAADRASSSSYNLTFTYGGASGVQDEGPLPSVTRLAGAYPNPFNPMTTVAFDLDSPQNTRLEIFDLRGRLVRVLADEMMPAGRHERIWRGIDAAGRNVSSGVYMIRMTAGETVNLKRVSLLK